MLSWARIDFSETIYRFALDYDYYFRGSKRLLFESVIDFFRVIEVL